MTIFTTLLFTVHMISSTVATLSNDCSILKCDSKEEEHKLCMEVIQPNQQAVYIPLTGCAAKQFKCSLVNNEKTSSVSLSKCLQPTHRRNNIRQRRAVETQDSDSDQVTDLDKEQSNREECPKECPKSRKMVCARCAHDIYRTFLSACHLRQYQCNSNEKFELVSHRACYGSAPFVMGKNGLQHTNEMRLKGKFFTRPRTIHWTPKPTVNVTWPSRHPKPKSTTTTTTRTRQTSTSETTLNTTQTRPTTSTPTSITTPDVTTVDDAEESKTTKKDDQNYDDNDEVLMIDVDICPNDEDQDTAVPVPKVCSNITNYYGDDYMKVDLHPDSIEHGSPLWVVLHKGRKITSAVRADAGLVVGCEAYAGLDYSGTVIVRNKKDDEFIGLVFGYQSNSQFYLVTWKSKPGKYWIDWPYEVTADAGLHIKRVESKTGPGAYLRNALYSTESIKDEVTLLWQDPMKQGWKHLVNYNWQLLHRPHIGLIRLKVFRGHRLIADSGNIYDKVSAGGRIGVYAFSQENIEWFKMNFKCNDKIPFNLMPELPPDLQKISEVDDTYQWSNVSSKLNRIV